VNYKRSTSEKVFDGLNFLFMLLIMVLTIYPLLHVLAISLNDARDAIAGGIGIIPRKFSLESYQAVIVTPGIYHAVWISVARTVSGTALSIFITCMAAYALLDIRMPGYRFIYRILVISMFVGGGLIPTFLLYKSIGLYNNFLVYIIPRIFSVFTMILLRTYMKQIPAEMEESARLDGAGDLTIFFRVMIPLSVPIIATVSLFSAVEQWNSWQDTLYFTNNVRLESLQYLLMKVLKQAEAAQIASAAKRLLKERTLRNTSSITPESIKMSITMVATVPILLVYPFVQRYFVKGIMIGAVKG
jgi:putative aldouronate transport system permease protein